MDELLEKAAVAAGMIDSHFHSLEIAGKGLEPRAILSWCFENGLNCALDVSVSTDDFAQRRELTGDFPGIAYAAGIYPSHAQRFAASASDAEAMLLTLDRQLSEPGVVAVGEIGLDALRDYAPIELQLALFRAQLELAAAKDLPVVIHNRGCDDLVIEALRTTSLARGGVMHCFSSDYAAARSFVDLGFAISFAGNVTFKNAAVLQETARRLPDEAILVETDAPYLSPVPLRGRVNHPGNVGHTYGFLARIRDQPLARLVEGVAENFERVFGVDAARSRG